MINNKLFGFSVANQSDVKMRLLYFSIPVGVFLLIFIGIIYPAGIKPVVDDPNPTYYSGKLVDVRVTSSGIGMGMITRTTLYFEDGKIITVHYELDDLQIGGYYTVTHRFSEWDNVTRIR